MHSKNLLLLAPLAVDALVVPKGGSPYGLMGLAEPQRINLNSVGPLASGLQPLNNPQVVVGGIQGLGDITKATCQNQAIGFQGCVRNALSAVIGLAPFTRYGENGAMPVGSPLDIQWQPGFSRPTASCNFACAMRSAVPGDGTLTHIAYVTVSGFRYAIYYATGGADLTGGLSLLRAVEVSQSAAAITAVDQDIQASGIIVDYRFSAVELDSWNAFNPAPNVADSVSDIVANVLSSVGTLVSCVNYESQSVQAIAGLVSIGSNQAFQFGAGGIDAASTYYNQCTSMH